MSNEFEAVRDKLNSVGPGFCLAKWYQVTIYLQNGRTHSCHHPHSHVVPLEEIKTNTSALHNTEYKKQIRKQMLEGERPKECNFCWRIEDSHQDNLSDRFFKSSVDMNIFDKTRKLPWDDNTTPNYVEVSFGNECNFKCAYCAPHISSGIMAEYQTKGHYNTLGDWNLKKLKEDGLFPYGKDEHNPYVEAFWDWWPKLSKELRTFRITGGEPLLNPNTFNFLDEIIKNPRPDLEFAINSNLGIPDSYYERFVEKIDYILKNKLIKRFTLFTSLDTHGKNGEFIRFGMNYDKVMKNSENFLKRVPDAFLSFMCTYNAFSVINFDKFLVDVLELKRRFRTEEHTRRVYLDIIYLRDPNFLSVFTLPEYFLSYIKRDIEFMREHSRYDKYGQSLFYIDETAKLERIYTAMEADLKNPGKDAMRANLYVFLKEYQEKKNINFHDYCPEYSRFLALCKIGYLTHYKTGEI